MTKPGRNTEFSASSVHLMDLTVDDKLAISNDAINCTFLVHSIAMFLFFIASKERKRKEIHKKNFEFCVIRETLVSKRLLD